MFALAFSTVYAADEAGASSSQLTLSQALAKVLQNSPALAVYPYHFRAAEAQTLQAGLGPNPELSLEIENIAGDGEYSGTDSAEVTLALSQVIELGGKRRYRQDVAVAGRELVQRDYELARLETLAVAAGRFLDVVAAQQQLNLAEQADDWAQNAERATQVRVSAGSGSRAELSQARIEAYRTQLAIGDSQNNLQVARLQLAGQWGSEQPDFTGVAADIFQLSELPPFTELRSQLQQSPELRRYLTLDRLRQAELDLAIADGRQNVSVGLGVKRFETSGDQAFTLQFSMPLGVSNRNQGGIAAARADLERLGQEQSISRLSLFNELNRLYLELQHLRRTVEVLRHQALPEADRALEQLEQGYRRGRFSYLEWLEARRQRLEVERDAINAAAGFHRRLLALERLTGESLTTATRSFNQPHATRAYATQDDSR